VYRIEQERGIIFVLWDGAVTADEFLAHVQRLFSDAEWPPHRRLHLSDLRAASVGTSIDEATLQTAADLYGKHPKVASLKVAIVAGEAFEKAVIFERFVYRHVPSVIVFNSLNTACVWLGIDAGEAERTLQSLRAQSHGRTDR
jgi:hypothetical protein